MKLVQFGGGSIGRSFIGQVFNQHGYEVVFIDINQELISLLNQHGCYRVVVKQSGEEDRIIAVKGVRGIRADNLDAVVDELADADIASTAVGGNVLPRLAAPIAQGLLERRRRHGDRPLDIILAENIRDGGALMRGCLSSCLGADFPLHQMVGLIETSIGKMVPIMPKAALAVDPLWVFAEPYNTLILDRHGFRNPPPGLPEIKLVDNITAYVDRKLFIHNLGHAAAAYLGHAAAPDLKFIWECLQMDQVRQATRETMEEAAAGVAAEYPKDLTEESLLNHIDDLLNRFQNQALGDTVFRVGLDLRRKLGRHDRIIGAARLNQKHRLPYDRIIDILLAACRFRAGDEAGNMFPADAAIVEQEFPKGLKHVLENICGLSPRQAGERRIIDTALARSNH